MAFSLVQTSDIHMATTTSVVLTFPAGTGAGNLVVIYARSTITSITSISDTAGNTYVKGTRKPTGSGGAGGAVGYFSYGVQTTGGVTVITLTVPNGHWSAFAEEYSGNYGTNATAFDVQNNTSGTGTAITTPSISPAAAGELIIVHEFGATGQTISSDSGDYVFGSATNNAQCSSFYRLSGTTSESPTFTAGGSLDWGTIITAFKGPDTYIKTVDNLAKASVKTWNGLAIASVKSINGLT